MPELEGEIVIGRPPEEVFDFVADQRHEPQYNRQMSSSELLTPEPVGNGSRFQAQMSMLGRPVVELTVEFTRFERPTLLASRSWSRTRGSTRKPMLTQGELTFEPVWKGTLMHWAWHVETRGAMKPLAPFVVWMGRRQERRIWTAAEARPGDGQRGTASSGHGRTSEDRPLEMRRQPGARGVAVARRRR